MRGPKTSTAQDRAPIAEMLAGHGLEGRARFHVPGHKGGLGVYRYLAPVFGRAYLGQDLTELEGLDDLHWPVPGGPIAEAQALAAEAFGASEARFLAGGSTAGILALILAAVGPGQTLLVTTPFHRSVAAGAVLAGCELRALPPRLLPSPAIPAPAKVTSLERAVGAFRPAAVLVTSPTYHGLVADLVPAVRVAAQAGIPLLVDAAHGAHLGFSPDLPDSPARAGASAWVVSLHKTAGALTPGALLLLGPTRRAAEADEVSGILPAPLDPGRVAAALRLVQTSSPSFPVLASADLARRRLALRGRADWTRLAGLCREAARSITAETGGRLAPLEDVPTVGLGHSLAGLRHDPTRLVFSLASTSPPDLTGLDIARRVADAGVDLEMAGWDHVVAVATPADGRRELAHLVAALAAVVDKQELIGSEGRRELGLDLEKHCWEAVPAYPVGPSEAFHRPRRLVPVAEAEGRVAADIVCPYPPGVPLVVPGQRIDKTVAAYLAFLGEAGRKTQGLETMTSPMVEVVSQ